MDNPNTGQQVICYSGYYAFYEGAPQIDIAMQCTHACELHGFGESNNVIAKPEPKEPDPEMKQYIPEACLRTP